MKICIDCGVQVSEISTARCIRCANRTPERRAASPTGNARWRERHPEKYAAHNAARNKRGRDLENKRIWHRWYLVRTRYGIDKAQFENLFRIQLGLCAICKIPLDPFPSRKKTYIDHNHITGKVRGLLCPSCNIAVAAFENGKADAIRAYLNIPNL